MTVTEPSLPTSPFAPARTVCRTQLPSQTCFSTNLFRSSNLADLSNARRLIPLQALCRCEKTQLLWIQANPNSLCKTRRVAYSLRELLLYTEVQKCRSVSLLLATLTHSVSRKSFPCHSYENTRDGGASALFSSVRPRVSRIQNHLRHSAHLYFPRLMLYIAIQCRETPFRERFGAIEPTPVD